MSSTYAGSDALLLQANSTNGRVAIDATGTGGNIELTAASSSGGYIQLDSPASNGAISFLTGGDISITADNITLDGGTGEMNLLGSLVLGDITTDPEQAQLFINQKISTSSSRWYARKSKNFGLIVSGRLNHICNPLNASTSS